MTDQMQRLVNLADPNSVVSTIGNRRIVSIDFKVRGVPMTCQQNLNDPLIYAIKIAEWDDPIGALEKLLKVGAA